MKWNWQQDNWPNWEIDSKQIEHLEKRFLLRAGYLGGLWEYLSNEDKEAAKISILCDEAVKTSEIEGEIFDRDSVRSSIRKHFGLQSDRRAGAGENGIAKMMVECYQSFDTPLSEADIFYWHTLICNGRQDLEKIGAYRTHREAMQIVSGQIDRPKVHFQAPESQDVPKEMNDFINWLQDTSLGVLAQSSIAHLYFTSIHPFEDGNGRLGRAISEHILSHELGKPSLIMLSSQVEKEKKYYYDMLERNSKSMTITPWVVWFSQSIVDAQEYSIQLLELLIVKTKILSEFQGKINSRQEKMLLKLFDAGVEGFVGGLSAKNYTTITQSPPATTTRDLSDLVKKGILRKTGERKSTRYFLNI